MHLHRGDYVERAADKKVFRVAHRITSPASTTLGQPPKPEGPPYTCALEAKDKADEDETTERIDLDAAIAAGSYRRLAMNDPRCW